MENPPQRVRVIRKTSHQPGGSTRTLRLVLATLAVLLVAAGLWRWKGASAYLRWTKQRQLDNAERLFTNGRLDAAATAVRRVVNVDPTNLRAVRLMAELADRFAVRDAVQWRQRVVELEPWNSTNLVNWAQSALRHQDYFTALKALNRYPTNAAPPAYFHDTAGAVALGMGDTQQADRHFAEAARLDPDDLGRQLNLAKVRLFAEGAPRQEEARRQLGKLLDKPAMRGSALALLAEDALRQRKWKDAVQFSTELVGRTNATFADRLTHLQALRGSSAPSFTNQLQSLQAKTVGQPGELAQLLLWMGQHGLAPQAMAWVRSLTPEDRQPAAVSIAIADLFIGLRDWLGLRDWVRNADWGQLNSYRFAYDAYAAQFLANKETRNAEVDGLWSKALTAAGKDASQLELLAKVAARWNLAKQIETTWWAVADSGNGLENALMVLHRLYVAKDDTLGRYRVAQRLFKLKPSDLAAQNNVVYLGLLLGVADSNLQSLADQLHLRSPKNPDHLSTYAFALYRRNQAQAAADLMGTLNPADLRRPAMAAMQGVFLAKAGDTVRAREFLKLGAQAKLLPEEEKLVEEARAIARAR